MRRYLEEVLSETRLYGPRVVLELRTKLRLKEAQTLVSILRREGFNIEAYDFPRTQYVWHSKRKDGVKYTQLATKELILTLARNLNVDPFTPEGFKLLLPDLTFATFKHQPINEWRTTLGGLIKAYDKSPSHPVLELIAADNDFIKVRRKKLQPSDFSKSPTHMWVDKMGNPTKASRTVTKQVLEIIAEQQKTDYLAFSGFSQVTAELTYDNFTSIHLNFWGTTPSSMLTAAYRNKVHLAVEDLVNNDPEFEHLRSRLYDLFPKPRPFLKKAAASLQDL